MQRTRKWAYVAQEARRLADLGLTPRAIADRLEVNQSTVNRWMVAGKLRDTRVSVLARVAIAGAIPVPAAQVATDWATRVRASYALNATDVELVRLAEMALTMAQDPAEPVVTRLSAMTRFQALVKQLALAPPVVDELAPAPPPVLEARAPRVDPRGQFLNVQ